VTHLLREGKLKAPLDTQTHT